MERTPCLRFYLGFLLIKSSFTATRDTGLNLQCVNDFDSVMFCQFRSPPNEPNCSEYKLNTYRNNSSSCNLTHDTNGTCSCYLNITKGFVVGEIYTTTLWKAGDLVVSKNISAYDNIKPKAPKNTSLEYLGDGNYLVTWNTGYDPVPSFNLKVILTYRIRGQSGKEVDVSSMKSYPISAKFLLPSTEYLVSIRSKSFMYSESSADMPFTTPMSTTTVTVVVIVCLCVGVLIATSVMYLLYARVKENFWDNVGNYKQSSLLVMVPGEHKVLMPQKTLLCSVYVSPHKEVKEEEKLWDKSSRGSYCFERAVADSVSSSLGYPQKVSFDIISDMEEAMSRAFPEISLCPNTVPWLCVAHSNISYSPVPGTSNHCSFDNMTYSTALPSATQGLIAANPLAVLSGSFYSPNILMGVLHNPSPDAQVPIFQLTGQRPFASMLDSSHMKTDCLYQSWNADLGSSSPGTLEVDLSYCPSSCNATSSSVLGGLGYLESGVCSTGEFPSEGIKDSLLVRAADRSSMTEDAYGEGKQVCDSNLYEESRPSAACSLFPVDDEFQGFQSMGRRPGVLPPEVSGGRTRDWSDTLPENVFTGMPQRALPTNIQGVQGLLEPQVHEVSLLHSDQQKLILISDYHCV